jgi:Arylsulfotransferase (ASST)
MTTSTSRLHAARARALIISIAVLVGGLAAAPAFAQNTVGLIEYDPALTYPGYTLFAPNLFTTTYLIDIEGNLVRSWSATLLPGNVAYLLESGHLIRTANVVNASFSSGGRGGRVQEFDWDGTLLWDFTYSSTQVCQHHDVETLPNGNLLIIAWEKKTVAQAIAAGRNPARLTGAGLWPDHIVEVQPTGATTGTIVWEWHAWDHLVQDFDSTKANYGVVFDNPQLVDINFTRSGPGGAGADWLHTNSIQYNAALDQIVLSVHALNEIWVIDHSTTTAEAASHSGGLSGRGGDLLYRWGNPRAYDRGTIADQKLSGQHDAQWIAPGLAGAGRILVFNNGTSRGWSSVDEIETPVDSSGNYTLAPGAAYEPDTLTWTYSAPVPADFYAQNISGAHRLENGNTLICDGPDGTFFQVTSAGERVWIYINPVTADGPVNQGETIPDGANNVFRAYRYGVDFPGFDGRDLTPQGPIEGEATWVDGDGVGAGSSAGAAAPRITLSLPTPHPCSGRSIVRFELSDARIARLTLHDVQGRLVRTLTHGYYRAGEHAATLDAAGLAAGVYFLRIDAGTAAPATGRVTILK